MKILVIGGSGQIGSELRSLSRDLALTTPHTLDFPTRTDLDMTDSQAIARFFATKKYDFCINAAAYTAVDKAETERDLAVAINVTAVQHIAENCAIHNVQLVHLSSDYVYHRLQNDGLLTERTPAAPQGVYATTKLAGEAAALAALPNTVVLRTSWVYSAHGSNFVKTMLRLGRERAAQGMQKGTQTGAGQGAELRVVTDQIGAPTYARDLAESILQIITQIADNQTTTAIQNYGGIYNYSNEGITSWYDFAYFILHQKQVNCSVVPIATAEYPTPAARPFFSAMDKTKLKNTFHIQPRHWHAALCDCLENLP